MRSNIRDEAEAVCEKPRVLVHLHVFYPKLLGGYLKRLKEVRDLAAFHMVATISESIEHKSAVVSSIKRVFPDAEILIVPNVGYDLGPFVEAINGVNLDEYDYILKLHTKGRGEKIETWLNDIRVSDSIWVDMLVDGLLGTTERFETALESLSQDCVGLVTAQRCIIHDRPARRDYYHFRVNDELSKMGFPAVDDLHFAAGTMFMARAELFNPLAIYCIDDFGKCTPGISDYTLAHTFERLLSGLVLAQGYELRGLSTKAFDTKRVITVSSVNFSKKRSKARSPKIAASAFARRAKRRLRFELLGRQVISGSTYFDASWYLQSNPDIGTADPAVHYLRHGYKEGRNPSRFFDNELYYKANPDIKELGYNPLLHYECYKQGSKRRTGMPSTQEQVRLNAIRSSPLFNENWYLANNPDARECGIDPAEHYLKKGGFAGRDPSPLFCSAEYLAIHPDVKSAGANPLWHYLTEGVIQGRELSSLEIEASKPHFPDMAEPCAREFGFYPPKHRRTAIVAAFVSDGILPESLVYLLRGLREVVDNIVLIGDSPLFPSELDKLVGIVSYAQFERASQYDFGSYKRGLRKARELDLLDESDVDELVFINDSCYGPVYPLSESFEIMSKYKWDFWGYTSNKSNSWYVCSYFMTFNRKVIDSKILDEFFCRVKDTFSRGTAIDQFEVALSRVLRSQGMCGASLVGWNDYSRNNHRKILTGLRQYRIPLVKKKSLAGESLENIQASLEIIKHDNPEIYEMIDKRVSFKQHKLINLDDYRRAIPETERRIAGKLLRDSPVKVIFLVNDAAMFPGKPLMDLMLDDELFDPYVAVIPDTRWPKSVDDSMVRCETTVSRWYADERVIRIRRDRYDRWPDVLSDADIVCYPSPYNVSEYNYNVRYAMGRQFLPIIFNYGFYRSIYDREILGTYNYAYFWKAFFECPETLDEYVEYSVLHGENASLSGYVKMDSLSNVRRTDHVRPRILVALHHSVEGGFNDTLALANFIRYYDYFCALPDSYPDIDFVYRPHPALFKALEKVEGWTDERVDSYISEMQAKPNVIWSDGGDYFQEFVDSDACIQDCGSFLVEYLYTGKPCCYMLKSPEDIEEKFAPLGKACLEQCYISYSTDDIDDFILGVVIGGYDPKAEGRAKLAKHVMVNYPHAAEAALQDIKDSILNSTAEYVEEPSCEE